MDDYNEAAYNLHEMEQDVLHDLLEQEERI